MSEDAWGAVLPLFAVVIVIAAASQLFKYLVPVWPEALGVLVGLILIVWIVGAAVSAARRRTAFRERVRTLGRERQEAEAFLRRSDERARQAMARVVERHLQGR
jgi:hypothetical protein